VERVKGAPALAHHLSVLSAQSLADGEPANPNKNRIAVSDAAARRGLLATMEAG